MGVQCRFVRERVPVFQLFFYLVAETDTTEGATHPETLRFQNCTNSGTIAGAA